MKPWPYVTAALALGLALVGYGVWMVQDAAGSPEWLCLQIGKPPRRGGFSERILTWYPYEKETTESTFRRGFAEKEPCENHASSSGQVGPCLKRRNLFLPSWTQLIKSLDGVGLFENLGHAGEICQVWSQRQQDA